MTSYEMLLVLPSQGLLNEGIPDGKVKIRAMTLSEEKKMYSASKAEGVFDALSSCIVEPEGIRISELHPFDQMFLLVNIRRLTYGDKYAYKKTCPECKSVIEGEIDLSELDDTLQFLPEDYESSLEVELPVKGDKLTLKLLSAKESERLKRVAQTQASKLGLRVKEVEYDIRLAALIESINDEPVDLTKARVYIKDMHSRDIATIMAAVDSVVFGYNTDVVVDCPNCGPVEMSLPIGSEFFRPKH